MAYDFAQFRLFLWTQYLLLMKLNFLKNDLYFSYHKKVFSSPKVINMHACFLSSYKVSHLGLLLTWNWFLWVMWSRDSVWFPSVTTWAIHCPEQDFSKYFHCILNFNFLLIFTRRYSLYYPGLVQSILCGITRTSLCLILPFHSSGLLSGIIFIPSQRRLLEFL